MGLSWFYRHPVDVSPPTNSNHAHPQNKQTYSLKSPFDSFEVDPQSSDDLKSDDCKNEKVLLSHPHGLVVGNIILEDDEAGLQAKQSVGKSATTAAHPGGDKPVSLDGPCASPMSDVSLIIDQAQSHAQQDSDIPMPEIVHISTPIHNSPAPGQPKPQNNLVHSRHTQGFWRTLSRTWSDMKATSFTARCVNALHKEHSDMTDGCICTVWSAVCAHIRISAVILVVNGPYVLRPLPPVSSIPLYPRKVPRPRSPKTFYSIRKSDNHAAAIMCCAESMHMRLDTVTLKELAWLLYRRRHSAT